MSYSQRMHPDVAVVHNRDVDRVSDLQALVVDWAKRAFPDRNLHTVIHKLLVEEWCELAVSLSRGRYNQIEDELADVMILLLDLCDMLGVDMGAAIRKKMRINEVRTWIVDSHGMSRHSDEDVKSNT